MRLRGVAIALGLVLVAVPTTPAVRTGSSRPAMFHGKPMSSQVTTVPPPSTPPEVQATPPANGAAEAAPVSPTTTDRPSRGQRPRTPPPNPPGGGVRVSSTAYCLTGTMANGRRAADGYVAANRWPLGTRLRVAELGRVFVVGDRIGHGSQLDIAMPGRCGAARQWGRRTVTVEVVP